MMDLLEVVFQNPKDKAAELLESLHRTPENVLFFTTLLERISSFPFKKSSVEVLALAPHGKDWEPSGEHYELEYSNGWLKIDGEKLREDNPFPFLGTSYTVWVVEDAALRALTGYETGIINLAPAQIVEAEVKGVRWGWKVERKELPSHPLLALSSFKGGAVMDGHPLFHPSQLVNRPFIRGWERPEVKVLDLLLQEAASYAEGLLLNEGKGQDLFYVDPFEEVGGKYLIERALEEDLYIAPSDEGWEEVEEEGPGRVKVYVREGPYITLYQLFGKEESEFLLRKRHFVRRKVGKGYVLAPLEG